ncbi:hypothetical protein DPMN_110643 [Dreissena polymorpha]|uniref:Uncharacterized protein n=1 Tax=Dreissena polymorpha TaxID=45954 RepID=A0A9D4KCE1_DREPO|nr:hypothetical protein DPMN_110643 [Dreissena polymorpha]
MVANDMKVKQTIQIVSQVPGGHYGVGETSNSGAVADFELVFHEIASITSHHQPPQSSKHKLMNHT